MRSDARLLLNKKKWRKTPGNKQPDVWKSRGSVDARKILNLKRRQQTKPPVLGSFMRTTSATALIASQIKKEISAGPKVDPNKRVQLSRDGNIIVTSKSKTASRVVSRKEGLPKVNIASFSKKIAHNESMEFEPSTSVDDLEHTAIEDLIDVESLPAAYVPAISHQKANLSRKSVMSQILDNRYTMVADQFAQLTPDVAKVQVSNLHSSVSRQDVMELFGEIGVIRSIDVIMPGTAIVEFFNKEDAIKACNIYHNRLLDGLPMQCYLVNYPSSQRSLAVSQRLGSRSEPNPHARLQGVSPAVTNSRSRYNPRNVQFTVKLT